MKSQIPPSAPRTLWLSILVLLAGACGLDSGVAATSEPAAESRAALTAGAGSVGDCNGNPARCAAVNLAAGAKHSVALRSDGTVWAWGGNSKGELGDGTTLQRNTPGQVSGLSDVTAVATGVSHTMALKSDGTVWAWGNNHDGQLGDNTTTQQLTPVQVSGLSLLPVCGSSMASCNAGTGVCSAPAKPDGATCSLGTCQTGVCTPPADAGAGADADAGAEPEPEPELGTNDLSCRFNAPPGATSPRAAWIGAIALLALRRRRTGLPRPKQHSL